MEDNLKMLYKLIVENNSLKFGEFKLSSGAKSSIYLDLRKLLSDPKSLRLIPHMLREIIENNNIQFDTIVGIATGGLPWASILAYIYEKPLAYVRSSKKPYGTENLVEGYLRGKQAIIIDDVATTGKSLLSAVNALSMQNMTTSACIVIVDRGQGAETLLRKVNVKLYSIAKLSTILHLALSDTRWDKMLIKNAIKELNGGLFYE